MCGSYVKVFGDMLRIGIVKSLIDRAFHKISPPYKVFRETIVPCLAIFFFTFSPLYSIFSLNPKVFIDQRIWEWYSLFVLTKPDCRQALLCYSARLRRT